MKIPQLELGRDEILQQAYELGFRYEQTASGCAQCVLAAIQDLFGIIDDNLFKAGQILAAGGALSGCGSCGALNGGLLVLSRQFGRDRKTFNEGKSLISSQIIGKKLYDRFKREFGSCICQDVQKRIMGESYNLWDPIENEEFLKNGGHKDKCPDVVGKVTSWTAELLMDNLSQIENLK